MWLHILMGPWRVYVALFGSTTSEQCNVHEHVHQLVNKKKTLILIPFFQLLNGVSHIQHSVRSIYQDDSEVGNAYTAFTLSFSYDQFQ
jgi:hypothetical protein